MSTSAIDREVGTTQTGTFRDTKRHLWWLPIGVILSVPIGIFLAYSTGLELWAWLTMALYYLVLPVTDKLVGRDARNPPDEAIPGLEADRYYRNILYASVPLFYLAWIIGAWAVSSLSLSWFGYLGVTLGVALTNGLALVAAHELGHKKTAGERLLAQITLAVPAYGHFSVEHNRGHHKDVATPPDPASARFGESLYRFAMREYPGAIRRAWGDEKQRLARTGKSFWSMHNEILQSYAITVALYGGAIVFFGPVVIPFVLISAVLGWQFLTTSNYIEHYGLLRQKTTDGRYERVRSEHSWNADHLISNLALYHLQRHSDHHAYPTRRFQSLRNHSAPELPAGYPGCFLLAYIPPLWRAVMDPRVLEVYGGDISKVNIDPSKREQILGRHSD